MRYEYECIKTIERVKSYGNFIQLKKTLTSLFPTMFNFFDKKMAPITCNAQIKTTGIDRKELNTGSESF